MPCLYISTNINLDGIDIDPIFSEATVAVSTIIGKPEKVCHTLSLSLSSNECFSYIKIMKLGVDIQINMNYGFCCCLSLVKYGALFQHKWFIVLDWFLVNFDITRLISLTVKLNLLCARLLLISQLIVQLFCSILQD